MKTNVLPSALLAMILAGATATVGCSSFSSGSSDYVGPGGLSNDVSELPDPNANVPARRPHGDVTVIHDFESIPVNVRREPETPERMLALADRHFEQKRYSDASLQYKKFLKTPAANTSPADLLALVHYRLGTIERKRMLFANALKEFKQASELAPQNNDYLFSYAKTCYESGDFQSADRQFVALLNRNAAYPEAQRYYGLTLLESSNRTNALTPLTAAVGELEAYALLTDKYYEKGELEQATQAEGQTLQIAARLGKQAPEFPSKPKPFGQPSAYASNAYQQPNASVNVNEAFVAQQVQVQDPNAAQGYLATPSAAPQNVPTTDNSTQAYMGYAPAFEAQPVDAAAYIPTTESVANVAQTLVPTTEAVVAQSVPAPNAEPIAADPQNFITPNVNAGFVIAPTETSSAVVETTPVDNMGFATSATLPVVDNAPVQQETPSYSLSASASLLQDLEEATNAEPTVTPTAAPSDDAAFASSGTQSPELAQEVPVFAPIPYVPTQAPAPTPTLAPAQTQEVYAQPTDVAYVPEPNTQPLPPAPQSQEFMQYVPSTQPVEAGVALPPAPQPAANFAATQPAAVQEPQTQLQQDLGAQVYAQAFPADIPLTTQPAAPIAFAQPVETQPETAAVEVDEDGFAFATSGSSVPITIQPVVPAPTANAIPGVPAIAAYAPSAAPQAYVPSGVPGTASPAPTYVAAVPTNNVPMNAPQTYAAPAPAAATYVPTQVPTTQAVPQPAVQAVPQTSAVQGVLPTDSLFNLD